MKKREITWWLQGRVLTPVCCDSDYAQGYKDGLRDALAMVEMLDEPEEDGLIRVMGARTPLTMPAGERVLLFGSLQTLAALRWALVDDQGEKRRARIADAILDSISDYKEEVKRNDRKRKEDPASNSGSPTGDVQ